METNADVLLLLSSFTLLLWKSAPGDELQHQSSQLTKLARLSFCTPSWYQCIHILPQSRWRTDCSHTVQYSVLQASSQRGTWLYPTELQAPFPTERPVLSLGGLPPLRQRSMLPIHKSKGIIFFFVVNDHINKTCGTDLWARPELFAVLHIYPLSLVIVGPFD